MYFGISIGLILHVTAYLTVLLIFNKYVKNFEKDFLTLFIMDYFADCFTGVLCNRNGGQQQKS